jgi:hypothetical protein
LAVVVIGTQVLGDVTNIFYGRIIQGVVGVTIAGALLFYMTRPYVRASFVAKPKQIGRSHDPWEHFYKKILAYVVTATIFEVVGNAVVRIALRSPYALPGRIALFALASVLLSMYGLFLNLAPVEFATVTGIYIASLFVAFQIVNYLFFGTFPRLAFCWADVSLSLVQRSSTSGSDKRLRCQPGLA